MKVTSKIQLDLKIRRNTPQVNAVQYDVDTREVEIALVSSGVPWRVPEGVSVAVGYRKPDGTRGLYDKLPDGSDAVTVHGSTVKVILPRQMLTVHGVVRACLVFNNAELDQLTTFPFWVCVQENPAAGAEKSDDYIRLKWLEEKLDEYLRKAAASGEFDGLPGVTPHIGENGHWWVGDEDTGVSAGGGTQASVTDAAEPGEEDIPKIFFGGDLPQTKEDAVMTWRYISKTQDISGYCETRAQGNSSMSYPKKNQTVKLYADPECTQKLKVDFKGWGKQRKHCYKANWIDLTHARNVVSARLWADCIKSRADYESLPELLRTSPNQGAADGFPVKVYANGVYQGRYTLNIPKDAWMANMDDSLDEHCILCGENYDSGCFRAAANINETDWTDEVHDIVPDSIKTRWNEVIRFVMNSTDEEFKTGLSDYFYVDSLIDYYLFGLASCGLDAFGKNQLYMTYDGQKWIAQMYDMDSTWGLWWNGSSFVATDYDRSEFQDFQDGEGNLLYIRLEKLFYEELQARWAELRVGALSMENIISRFERFTDIAPAELVKEDYASTTGGGNFTGIPGKTTNNIQQIRAFALARRAWTDEYVAGLTPEAEIPCEGVTLDNRTLTFTAEGSQTLTATVTPDGCTDEITWESDNTNIATVDGGVVTAVANGSCSITAKCGAYSAVCSVSVSGISEPGGGEDAEIDYTRNPLDGVTWSLGLRNAGTGEVKESTTDYMTDKFELQNCMYQMEMSNGASWNGLYIWNENDEYVGGCEVNSNIGRFMAKAGWKYVIKVNGDYNAVSLMPVDQSVNTAGVSSVTIDGASAEWSTQSRGSEIVITDAMVAAGFATTSSQAAINNIYKCSHTMILEYGLMQYFKLTGVEPVLNINCWQGAYYLVANGIAADDAPALVGTVTFN